MLTTVGLGILASLASEAVTWLNQKFSGTVLKGDAAFVLALVVSLIGATGEVFLAPGFSFTWATLAKSFAEIWTVAQVFFVLVVQTLGLDVQSAAPTSTTA